MPCDGHPRGWDSAIRPLAPREVSLSQELRLSSLKVRCKQVDSASPASRDQEVAKATGKVVDAASGAGGFFAEFLRETLKQVSGIASDALMYRRAELAMQLHARLARKAKEIGFTTPSRRIPLAVQVPLLEAATLEEEPELQERWVNLLLNYANGASGIAIERGFTVILQQLSPLEARILDVVYALPKFRF